MYNPNESKNEESKTTLWLFSLKRHWIPIIVCVCGGKGGGVFC